MLSSYCRSFFLLAIVLSVTGAVRAQLAIFASGELASQSAARPSQMMGKQLRSELKSASAASRNVSPKKAGEIATAVILKYIPLGSSFHEAEAILSAAGFTVRYPPAVGRQGIDGTTDRVTASLRKMDEVGVLWKVPVNLYVYLFPASTQKFDHISRVEAFVDVPMP
jgi:hypothetical protein